jgi:hypothetical protein
MREVSKNKLRKITDTGGLVVVVVASKEIPFMRTLGPHIAEVEKAGYKVYHKHSNGALSTRIEFYKDGKLQHTAYGFQPKGEILSIIERVENAIDEEPTEETIEVGETFEETETKQTEGET